MLLPWANSGLCCVKTEEEEEEEVPPPGSVAPDGEGVESSRDAVGEGAVRRVAAVGREIDLGVVENMAS